MARQCVFIMIFAIIAIVLPKISLAKEFIVGDEHGWTTAFDYEGWAKDKDFRVGDTLVFKYPVGVHNVFKVEENAYKSCIVPPADDKALTSGKDTITLDKPGKQWFLCGVGMHCEKGGQKLQVDVKDGSSGKTATAPTTATTTAPTTAAPSQAPAATESSNGTDGAAVPSPSKNSSNGLKKTGYQLPLAIMAAIVAFVV